METNVIIISLKPEFATKIYAGIKGFEYRKHPITGIIPTHGTNKNTWVAAYIYETAPISAITGIMNMKNGKELTPEAWAVQRPRAGITREQLDIYAADKPIYSHEITKAHRCKSPDGGFLQRMKLDKPPQSWQRLDDKQLEKIQKHFKIFF